MYTPSSSVMGYFRDLIEYKSSRIIPKFKIYWENAISINVLTPILEKNNLFIDHFISELKKIALGKNKKLFLDPYLDLLSPVADWLDRDNFKSLFSHLLIKAGYLTPKDDKKYGYPANEVKLMINNRIITGWLKRRIFLNTWIELQPAKTIDFYNDNIETISRNIEKLTNIGKKGLENFNERTFESIMLPAFILSKNSENYKIWLQSSSGNGDLDIIIYFHDRVDIYKLKFILRSTVNNAEKTLEEVLEQIHEKKYVPNAIEKINGDESKKRINSIRLIPMLLCKMDSEADYQCKIGSWEEYKLVKVIDPSSRYSKIIEKKAFKER